MIRIWTHSPVAVVTEAFGLLLLKLGFETCSAPDGADVALIDLSSHEAQLPPAPTLASVAVVGPSLVDPVATVRRLGYRGVVRANEGAERLRAEIVAVAGSGWSERVLASGVGEDEQPPLTPREAQVLGLLMLGLPNKRIAARLGITERTIKHHVSSLMRKYQAQGRLGLLVKSQTASRS